MSGNAVTPLPLGEGPGVRGGLRAAAISLALTLSQGERERSSMRTRR